MMRGSPSDAHTHPIYPAPKRHTATGLENTAKSCGASAFCGIYTKRHILQKCHTGPADLWHFCKVWRMRFPRRYTIRNAFSPGKPPLWRCGSRERQGWERVCVP
jgi:hypothetical protein